MKIQANATWIFGLLPFCLLQLSCLPISENQVASPAGSEVDPASYLGDWRLTEMLGSSDIAECYAQKGNGATGSRFLQRAVGLNDKAVSGFTGLCSRSQTPLKNDEGGL